MTWKEVLGPIKETEYFRQLWSRVKEEYTRAKCFPPRELIFRALNITPFSEVKVVIIGQDPYHGDHQANGLCFSVSDQVKAPPSLKNIYKELEEDVGVRRTSNDLEPWARQGVLLLNATLSVRAHSPNSHSDLGWEKFTDFIIRRVSEEKEHVAFVLWGAFAGKKSELISPSRHLVIKSAHPSPFSAHRGFFGSKPFSKINDYLISRQKTPISW